MKTIIVVLLLCSSIPVFAESALESLVNAERSFSKMSEEKGLKTAFVEFFADDSVIFRDSWIPGRKFYMNRPESPGLLTWDPRIADISRNGDLGYTTGPWEFRRDGEAANVAHGYYMSVWKKQPDGTWKVLIDEGISTPGPSPMQKDRPIWAPASGSGPDAMEPRQTLLDEERAFSKVASEQGITAAYREKAVRDFLAFRNGEEPAGGEEALKLISQAGSGACSVETQIAEASGDLGYAYGTWSRKGGGDQVEKGGFVRLWKQQPDGSWKIVLDVTVPTQ